MPKQLQQYWGTRTPPSSTRVFRPRELLTSDQGITSVLAHWSPPASSLLGRTESHAAISPFSVENAQP